MKRNRNHAGFTLVEVLVAMTLGLVVMGVLLMMFSSTKHTQALQNSLTRVQEDGRIAINVIADEARKAGFRKPVWNDPASGYTPITNASTNGSSGGNDALQVMYMDDLDCNGVVNTNFDPETTEPRALYKRVSFSVDNAQNLLWTCEYGPTPANLAVQANNQPIVDGVESFQVLYGIDTDFPPDFSINAWATADAITPSAAVCLQSQYLCETGNLMSSMRAGIPVALKIGMLIASPENAGSDVDSNTYSVLDVAIAAPNDNLLRKAYATTVTLRNLTL